MSGRPQQRKMSAKEREILARQKQVAASMAKKASAAQQQAAGSAASKSAPPANNMRRPSLKKKPSSQSQQQQPSKPATDLSFLSEFGMKPPTSSKDKKEEKSNGSTHISGSNSNNHDIKKRDSLPLPPPKPSQNNNDDTAVDRGGTLRSSGSKSHPIRPTLKSKNRQRALAVAAAAQKQQTDDDGASNNDANKESPLLVKKKKDASQGKASGALAQLVQNLSSTVDLTQQDGALTFQTIEPDDFWKNLRDWDFCASYTKQQQQQQQNGNNNKNNNEAQKKDDGTTTTAVTLTTRPLPNVFFSTKQYMALWAPLVMQECRAQLLQEVASRPTRQLQQPIAVKVELMQDGFTPFDKSNKKEQLWDANAADLQLDTGVHVKINPVQQQRGGGDGQVQQIMANDLVLLLQDRDFFLARHQGTHNNSGLVGHAEVTRKGSLNNLIVKVNKRKWAKLGSQNEMYMVHMGANVTALREFTALCQVGQLPLKRYLLAEHLEDPRHAATTNKSLIESTTNESTDNKHQQPRRRSSSSMKLSHALLQKMGGTEALGQGFIEYASKKFNASQLTAIAASAVEYGEGGFTLIKGPPGTGKTTTLVAVLNSLHIRQYNKYYSHVREMAASTTGSRQNALQMARKAKPRLLVCAPSNAAVDNILQKIMQDGFVDGQGQRYNPSMIRVGVGQSSAVRAVALETKVDAILNENLDLGRLDASIAGYRVELQRITQEMHKLRNRVQAMAAACPWPLSRDWEIRVDDATFDEMWAALSSQSSQPSGTKPKGGVYFVNHKDKTTTYEVPPPPEPGDKQFPASSMPEYRAYVAKIVKLVENYFTVKTHLERCTIVKSGHDQGANHMDVHMNLETHVLNDVHIVMTTLGTAGNRVLEQTDKFEVVVVDEAAQSVEPATLSALQLGSRHAVLVGDPQQLPATIFNVSGRNSKYDRSLFQRLEEAGQPVYMLNEQYRMHPDISHFPRHIFYGGNLLDGPNVTNPTYGNRLTAVLQCRVPRFKPFTILDLDSTEERGGTSLSNKQEAQLAVFLYERLREFGRELVSENKVAIITPYAQQCHLLRRSFHDALGPQMDQYVEINSVDAFQGREANIVIFSAVRAAGSRGIGFLSDVRRMNVALTRAKHFLFVIARCQSIVVNPYWRDLVNHARDSQAVLRVPRPRGRNGAFFEDPSQWHLEDSGFGGGGGLQRLSPQNGGSSESGAMPKRASTPPRDPRRVTAPAAQHANLSGVEAGGPQDPRTNKKRPAPPPPPPPPSDPRKPPPPPPPAPHETYTESQPSLLLANERPVDPRLAVARKKSKPNNGN